MKNTYYYAVLVILFALLPSFIAAQVVYVKHNATGSNNGSSWQNAYTDLQAALTNTTTGQVWVAAGTYWPGGNNPDPLDCFVVTDAFSIYGGFAGTETSLSQRNPTANPTILNGDHATNDPVNVFDSLLFLDNALHVMYVDSLIGGTTTIDGFTINGGITDDDNTQPIYFWRGGGIHAQSPVNIRNCHFTGHYARSGGSIALGPNCTGSEVRDCSFNWNLTSSQSAGIFADAVTDFTVKQCIFEDNKTSRGVIYPFRCNNVLIDSCEFAANENAAGFGAAIFNWNSQDIVLSNSNFTDNTAANAGAISINGSELPGIGAGNFIIENCYFEGNNATDFGGGAIYNSEADCTVRDCHFFFNTAVNGAHLFQNAPGAEIIIESCIFEQAQATGWGGAMTCYGLDANILVSDCIFDQNTATNLGGAANNGFGANVTYDGCGFNDNRSESSAGGALALQNSSTAIAVINCSFNGNSASTNGGAIFSGASESSSIVVVDKSVFLANSTESGVGGAIYVGEGGVEDISVLNISNSIFGFNEAPDQGGAVNISDSDANITSCLFFQNSANGVGTGGAISNNASDSNSVVVTLMNCTFAQNLGELAAGISNWTGTTEAFSTMTMQNCIFWHEGAIGYAIEDGTPELTSNGGNICDDNSLTAYFTHPKDIVGDEPTFVDIDDFDYHLTDNSLGVHDGVDAGAPPFDLEGNPRNSTVDMGAYENQTALGTGERLLTNDGLLTLSPNPAIGSNTNLKLVNGWRGNLEIKVVNTLGEIVLRFNAEKPGETLNLDMPLSPTIGVYNVLVSNGKEMLVERLVRL